MLGEVREEIAGILLDIFAASLAMDEVSEERRSAIVIPLFKKGSRNQP